MVNEAAKMFTVRIGKLELSKGHIPPTSIDPQKAFHFKKVLFYSNDILFVENQNGVNGRVLTAEEAYKNMPHTAAKIKRGQAVRFVFMGILGFSTIVMLVLLFKQTKKTKQNNES